MFVKFLCGIYIEIFVLVIYVVGFKLLNSDYYGMQFYKYLIKMKINRYIYVGRFLKCLMVQVIDGFYFYLGFIVYQCVSLEKF